MSDSEIISFRILSERNPYLLFSDVDAAIDNSNRVLSIEFKDTDELNSLVAEWELSEGAELYCRGERLVSGESSLDFSVPMELIVRASNGTTSRYSVNSVQDETCKVYFRDVVNSDFLGVNAVYHGFCYMPENIAAGMTEADIEKEVSRVESMGLNIARTWYSPDFTCGIDGTLYDEFSFETDYMRAFCRWLDRMKEIGVDIALQAGWWFGNHPFYGKPNPDYDKDMSRYSEWISASLDYLIRQRGYTNIKYLVLFTEPINDGIAIYDKGEYQYPRGGRTEYYEDLCRAIRERLDSDGLSQYVKLTGPQTTGGANDYPEFLGWSIEQMDDVIDIYTFHNYNGKHYIPGRWEYDAWQAYVVAGNQIMSKYGSTKPFWIDEYGHTDSDYRDSADYGNYLAQCVAAFTNNGAQSSLLWILFDQKYPQSNPTIAGVDRWGTVKYPYDTGYGEIPPPDELLKPRPSWYSFSMMSKYLGGRGGAKVFRTHSLESDSLFVTAVEPEAGELSIMVINGRHTSVPFGLVFDQVRPQMTLYRHLYDPSLIEPEETCSIIPADKEFQDVRRSLSDILPSRGVAIYTTIDD